MKNTAVTEEAPAVSRDENSQLTIEETMLETGFLPDDPHYRLTGEFKDESKDDKKSAAAPSKENNDDDEQQSATPGDKGDDTAAASEAATTQKETEQKKGPATTKTPEHSENRWQKRERELKELREKVRRLESAPVKRETEQVSQPAPAVETKAAGTARPKMDDVDPKTGKAKYATYAEFDEAKDAWNRAEAIREFQETHAKTSREQQQAHAEQVIERTINERVAEAKKTHADYETVITGALAQKNEHGQDAFFYTKGSPIDGFFLDSERGHDVMYAIAKDFDAHKHIFARDAQGKYLLNPVRQIRELAKIENSLGARTGSSSSDTTSAKPVTQAAVTKAPRPPNQVSGKGTVAKDAVEQAVEDQDTETYMREANARELASLKRN